MQVTFSSNFDKKIKKIPIKIVDKFFERLELFKNDRFNVLLKNHKLHGEYNGFNSINITANFRAVFKYIDEEKIIFYDIGTHSELYE